MLQQRNECCDSMKIRRQNYVAIMDFYVATLLEKFLKKCYNLCRDLKNIVVTRMGDRRQEECRDILVLHCNKDQRKWK